MTVDDDPRWSPDAHETITAEMNAVMRELSDILNRRSENGKKWVPPGEVGDFGDNMGLARAARVWVLDRLEERITKARRALDQVERDAAHYSGVSAPSGEPQPTMATQEVVYAMDGLFLEVERLLERHSSNGQWAPRGMSRAHPRDDLIRNARHFVLEQLAEFLADAEYTVDYWDRPASDPQRGKSDTS